MSVYKGKFNFLHHQFLLSLLNIVHLADKQQKPISVFSFTWPGFELSIYQTWDEYAN
jgi:predicted phosphohydrolase